MISPSVSRNSSYTNLVNEDRGRGGGVHDQILNESRSRSTSKNRVFARFLRNRLNKCDARFDSEIAFLASLLPTWRNLKKSQRLLHFFSLSSPAMTNNSKSLPIPVPKKEDAKLNSLNIPKSISQPLSPLSTPTQSPKRQWRLLHQC